MAVGLRILSRIPYQCFMDERFEKFEFDFGRGDILRLLAIVLAILIGIGFIVAATFLSQSPTSTTATGSGQSEEQDEPIPVIAAKGPYPKAVVPEREYDFGTMRVHDQGSHVFIVKNEGEAPLEVVVREKDTTCQCTVGKVENGKVPPGGETTVELKWEIKKFVENFRHSAKIRTNDPENPTIDMAITGLIDKDFHLSPEGVWDMGEIEGDQPAKYTGAVYSRMHDQFDISEVLCKNPRLKGTWTPLPPNLMEFYHAKSGYELHLEIDLHDLAGTFREPTQLKIPGHDDVDVGFEVRAKKIGTFDIQGRGWEADKATLHMGEFPAAEGKSATLSFFVRLENDIEMESFQSEHNAVKITWTKDEKYQPLSRGDAGKAKSARYNLKVEVLPGPAINRSRDAGEKVQVNFKHPQLGEIKLLVSYLAL